jgi:hypothetical protein
MATSSSNRDCAIEEEVIMDAVNGRRDPRGARSFSLSVLPLEGEDVYPRRDDDDKASPAMVVCRNVETAVAGLWFRSPIPWLLCQLTSENRVSLLCKSRRARSLDMPGVISGFYQCGACQCHRLFSGLASCSSLPYRYVYTDRQGLLHRLYNSSTISLAGDARFCCAGTTRRFDL